MYILSVLVLGTTLLFATGSGLAQEPDSSETPPVRGSAETADAAADSAPEIVAPAAPPVEPIESISEAINKAGRQRMLTQRMAALYLLLNWGLDDPQHLADYEKAVQEFDAALYELNTAGENTPQITEALQRVSSNWQVFKLGNRVDQGEYVPSLVTRVLDKILLQMNEITGMYADLQIP